jgi:aspartyl-tRNA synthetase
MVEAMTGLKRTHTCGGLGLEHAGGFATLMGWVHRRRDLGGLIFLDLRDRHGITQIVINPADSQEVFEKAEKLRSEFVIAVSGEVARRPEGSENPNLRTGLVEVHARELRILNTSRVPPVSIAEEQAVDESLRMKYRYLDLRRSSMLNRMVVRHNLAQAVRRYFSDHEFLEVETPVLVRSTPEGARDYLVPSRVSPGRFYALPQSPQLFKQLLMVGGLDRYFQIARCFRDEDLRADRQPEFTQIDVEMSFIERDDLLEIIEGLIAYCFDEILGEKIPLPIPRMSYRDAMESYGSDKPDLRFALPLIDTGDLLAGSEFKVLEEALAKGGKIKGICVPGKAGASRKDLDDLASLAKTFGIKGLLFIAVQPGGIKSSLSKFFDEQRLKAVADLFKAEENDLVILAADAEPGLSEGLGKLRLELAKKLDLIPPGEFRLAWVLDFPLYKWNEEEGRLEAEHHPFTSPLPEDANLLDREPLKVRAAAYDLVLNGNELGSGSIRIHQAAMQQKVFSHIGLSEEDARAKFGFLLEAFEYGAPPHGGIALGFDRMAAIMTGTDSIRDVIAFPKNQSAACPLTGAPVEVSKEQLEILQIMCAPVKV